MTKTQPESLPDRIAAVDGEIAQLEAARVAASEMLEDALAHDRDVAPIRTRIKDTEAAIDEAHALRRGLQRRQLVVDYDAHLAGIAEAEQEQLETGAAFAEIIGQLDECVAKFSSLESESIRRRVASDNSHVRVVRRREGLQRWLALHAHELERAQRAAAGSPAERVA